MVQSQADKIYDEWLAIMALFAAAADDEARIAADVTLSITARRLARQPIQTRHELRRRIEVALAMLDLDDGDPACLCLRSAVDHLSQES